MPSIPPYMYGFHPDLPVVVHLNLVGRFTEAHYHHRCVDTTWLSLGISVITFSSQQVLSFCLGFCFILFYSLICSFHMLIPFPPQALLPILQISSHCIGSMKYSISFPSQSFSESSELLQSGVPGSCLIIPQDSL